MERDEGDELDTTKLLNEIAAQQDYSVEIIEEETKVALLPELRPVCGCESSYEGKPWGEPRQFNPDGSLRRGFENSEDVGMCQINEGYHLEDSESMGYDIHTRNGNIKYANHLYRTQGYQPWAWSNPCHKKLSTQ